MIFPLIAFFLISALFTIFAVVVFYHIGRYSYIGDASKKIFISYTAGGILILLVTLILLIINHAIS